MDIELEIRSVIKQPFNKDIYKRLVRLVHPDVDPSYIELFHLLNSWKNPKQQLKIQAGKTYTLSEISWSGHLSNIYKDDSCYIKISKSPKANKLIKNEYDTLLNIRSKLDGTNLHKFFVEPIEFLELKEKVNLSAFSYNTEPSYSLKEIMEHRPDGLSDAEFGWIFKRILTAIDIMHYCGFLHTCITEDHVLLRPQDHGAYLCGLGSSTTKELKFKIFDHPFEPCKQLDIYQAGQLGMRITKNKKYLGFLKSLCLGKNQIDTNLVHIMKDLDGILPPKKWVDFIL